MTRHIRLALIPILLTGLAGAAFPASTVRPGPAPGPGPIRRGAVAPVGPAGVAERALRNRALRPASDGLRLLTRDVTAAPAYISPGTSPRSQDSTAISYVVIAPDTISLAIYLDEIIGDSLTGQYLEIQGPGTRRAPRPFPYVRIFNGFINEVPVKDGTYQLTVRAADDSGRIEEDRLPLEIDTIPPRLLEPLTEANSQSVFRNGDTIVLEARLDRPGYRVTADFSTLDSDLDPELTRVMESGDGGYTIHHLVSDLNTRNDGRNRQVRVTFRDLAGNSLVDTSLLFCLSNAAPVITSANYLPGPEGVYKNGATVRIETAWISTATPLTVTADFSNLDSRYDPARVAVTERAGNVFELAYEIDPDNERPDRPDYRVRIIARDAGCGTTTDTSLTVALDNNRPDTPTLIDPVTSTRLAVLNVKGRAAGSDYVVVRRGSSVLDTASVEANDGFAATVSLVPGENVLIAEGYDLAGNKSASLTFSVFRVTEAFVTLPARYQPDALIQVAPAQRADRLRLEFWSLSGNLVQILEDTQGGDLIDLSWDGLNSLGERVNNGPLLALFHIDYPDGSSEILRQAFVLMAP